jgi:tRNA nucleotidyltransferase (CCA-adding enzyme)
VQLWVVGGPLRDFAAGLPLRDLDCATDGDASAVASTLASHLQTRAHVEPRFGTARVEAAGAGIDLATLRSERYARPGALPTVTLGATLEEDLQRRDFSINAMALGVAGPGRGRLADPYSGLADVGAMRLRVLHDGSFRDDATRLWRAARFASRLRLTPDAKTALLIAQGAHWLQTISARRIWREFALTAAEPRAGNAVRTLSQWGALQATHRALAPSAEAMRALRGRGPLTPETLFALLVAQRAPAKRADAAARVGAPRVATRAADDAALLLEDHDRDVAALDALATTSAAGRAAARLLDPERQRPFQTELRRWETTRAPLDAPALLALGVPAGPMLGELLALLRRERYVGNLVGAPDARRLVQAWLDERRVQSAEGGGRR